MAADDGITHIVATPHFLYEEKQKAEEMRPSLEVLARRANEEGIPVSFLSGADIRLSYALMEGIERRDIPTINNSRYFLLELPEPIPPDLTNFFFTAEMSGLVAIITHPERNSSLLASPEKIGALRDSGALFQITAMSITGEFGGQLRSFCHMLFRKGFVDFVASDAHDPVIRKPGLSKAYREVVRIRGEREAQRIFGANPEAVIQNREIKNG
jgi:protein-tyrosine phosphatase